MYLKRGIWCTLGVLINTYMMVCSRTKDESPLIMDTFVVWDPHSSKIWAHDLWLVKTTHQLNFSSSTTTSFWIVDFFAEACRVILSDCTLCPALSFSFFSLLMRSVSYLSASCVMIKIILWSRVVDILTRKYLCRCKPPFDHALSPGITAPSFFFKYRSIV